MQVMRKSDYLISNYVIVVSLEIIGKTLLIFPSRKIQKQIRGPEFLMTVFLTRVLIFSFHIFNFQYLIYLINCNTVAPRRSVRSLVMFMSNIVSTYRRSLLNESVLQGAPTIPLLGSLHPKCRSDKFRLQRPSVRLSTWHTHLHFSVLILCAIPATRVFC